MRFGKLLIPVQDMKIWPRDRAIYQHGTLAAGDVRPNPKTLPHRLLQDPEGFPSLWRTGFQDHGSTGGGAWRNKSEGRSCSDHAGSLTIEWTVGL